MPGNVVCHLWTLHTRTRAPCNRECIVHVAMPMPCALRVCSHCMHYDYASAKHAYTYQTLHTSTQIDTRLQLLSGCGGAARGQTFAFGMHCVGVPNRARVRDVVEEH